jgi:hypothetical protein
LQDQTAIETLSELALVQVDRVQRSFFEAGDLVAGQPTIADKLSTLASALPGDVSVIHAFTTRAARVIDEVERDLETRQAASGGATNMESVVTGVLEAVSRFADVSKEVAR